MNDQPLKDILEIVQFLKDNVPMKDDVATKDDIANMATKDDIANMATKDDLEPLATKDDLRQVKNEMIAHVDAFVGLYQKHEAELAAVVSRQDRFEEKLNKIIKHLHLELS